MLREAASKDATSTVGVDLQMMTTNLSTGRPMRLPRALSGYGFRPEDLEGVFPPAVVRWLEDHAGPGGDGEVIELPAPDDLPILLGFRLSLSFPLLFAALPLSAPLAEGNTSARVVHWFSDGGIGSNFPIHLFDAWVPRRPTLALSFAPFPVDEAGKVIPGESDVGYPPAPDEERPPRWVPIDNLGGFFAQVLDTMQNWRDTLQSELPGFRDRVYQARLDKEQGEGGLNLTMDDATIKRLQSRGRRVGEAIVQTFDWDQHFYTRYLIAMQQLELGLVGEEAAPQRASVARAFPPRAHLFAAGDVGADELFGRDPRWLRAAGAATSALLEQAAGWGAFGHYVSDAPKPRPSMRITPDV
jgi:hypothetical protein